ncbi:MAG: hypothetical protein ACI4ES_06440 [Roseburia sp.]
MKRENRKKFWAFLLSLVMLFTTVIGNVNVTSFAGETEGETADEVTTSVGLEDGSYVIYCPAYGKALSSKKTGDYNAGVDMTLSDGTFESVEATEVWTVTNNEDGTITISQDEDKLSMDDSHSSIPMNEVNDTWTLEDAENGLYYIKNVARSAYLEWYAKYSNYSTYTKIASGSEGMFAMQFVPVSEEQITEPEEVEPLVEDGTYAIYCPEYSMALSSEKSTANVNYNAGVEMTLNAEGTFDSIAATEVWTITNNGDGTITISQGENKLSMAASYASTPMNEKNDTWTLEDAENGLYYVKNVGRSAYLEWYASKTYFSAYGTISSGSKGMFAMQFVPISEEQIKGSDEGTEEEETEAAIADGTYFIYSSSAEGVMKYDLTGGVASKVAATVTSDNKADFGSGTGEGAGVYQMERQSNGTYLIKCGSKYLSANSSEELYLADTAVNTTTNDSYWNIEAYESETVSGYTIASSKVTYKSNPIYMEYYSSKGFCLYTAKTLTDIYAFNFLDATGVANDDGYVGTKPAAAVKPEAGKSYVIYNASGKSVIGPLIEGVDGAEDSMGAVSAEMGDDTLTVNNGGLIFNVSVDGDYYIFENNGKYLASNNDEELFVQSEVDEYAKWELIETTGGFLLKNAKAAWTSSSGNSYPIYIEYFSGAFAGYSFKATSAEIFTFSFHEYEDTYGTGYVVEPKVVFNTEADANWGVDYTMNFTLDDLGTIKSVATTVTFEDNTTKFYTASVDGYDGMVTIPAEDLEGHTSASMKISVVSAETDTNNAEYDGTKQITIKDEPVIIAVSPAANSQTGSNKKPVVKISYANIGSNATAILTLNDTEVSLQKSATENAYTYTPSSDLSDGKYTASVTITRKDGKSVSKKWSFYVGTEGVQLYFGQIHSHTGEYSDGSGTLEQAYEYAMYSAANVDYMIVTDHSNYFDTTATATEESIYDAASDSILDSKTVDENGNTLNLWQEAKATAAYYDSLSTDFVSAYGYEMTWSGGPGHINVFNSAGIVSRNNTTLNNKTNNAGMLEFYDLLVDANSKNATSTGEGEIIAQFNHPGTTFGYFDSFTGWTSERDEIMNLIEVGNGDGAIGSSAYYPSYEYYDMCLSTGWHVAPTNGQDNHKGSWGDANTARTVVLTEDFTEEGLYEAMTARHVYSTEDQNLSVLYYLDETLQGGIIEGYDADTVSISVSLSDEDSEELGYVYVIGENGTVLYQSDYLNGNTADIEATLDNTSAYYYVKVIEKDGDIAVTAPVWVDDVMSDKAKVKTTISNASESTGAYPVVGTAEALKATLTNKEADAIDVLSYSVSIDGTTVASDTVSQTVASSGVYEVSYQWTPESYGTHKVVTSFVVSVNGTTSTVTATKNIYVAGKDYNTVVSVKTAKAGDTYEEFTVEGYVTANASGYDKNTAFFDCIYVQDDTAGINVFPVSGEYQVGQKVRVHGAITYYNGEIELNISSDYGGYIEVIDENISTVAPTKVNCAEAMADENIGLLMQITGAVTRVHEASGVTDRIYVTDAEGNTACVYINGYIWNSVTEDYTFGTTGSEIAVGDYISVIGLGSVDVDELGEVEYLHRLRIRDRAEINFATQEENTGDTSEGNTGDASDGIPEDSSNENTEDSSSENTGNSSNSETTDTSTSGSVISTTQVTSDILNSIIANGKDYVIDAGDYKWTIKAGTVTGNNNVNLHVTFNTNNIPVATIAGIAGDNEYMTLTLDAFDGPFGFNAELTVNVGAARNGLYGNLYYYNANGELEFIDSGLVDASGNLNLEFSHASDYVIIFSEADMNPNLTATPATGDNTSFAGLLLLMLFGATVLAFAKRRKNA